MEQRLASSVTHLIIASLNGQFRDGQSSFQHLLVTPKVRLKDILKRIFLEVPLFDSRTKEKNACPGKGLAWNREFIRMTCEISRYAP